MSRNKRKIHIDGIVISSSSRFTIIAAVNTTATAVFFTADINFVFPSIYLVLSLFSYTQEQEPG